MSVAKKMRMEKIKREREDPYDFKIEGEEENHDMMEVDTPHKKIKTESTVVKEEDFDTMAKVSHEGVPGLMLIFQHEWDWHECYNILIWTSFLAQGKKRCNVKRERTENTKKVGESDSGVMCIKLVSLFAQVTKADEWLSQAIPLPRSPRAGSKPKPKDSGSIFPELDDSLLDDVDEDEDINPLQVSMGISGDFDRTLVLEKEDSQADMFASDSDNSKTGEHHKKKFLANENAILAELEKANQLMDKELARVNEKKLTEKNKAGGGDALHSLILSGLPICRSVRRSWPVTTLRRSPRERRLVDVMHCVLYLLSVLSICRAAREGATWKTTPRRSGGAARIPALVSSTTSRAR